MKLRNASWVFVLSAMSTACTTVVVEGESPSVNSYFGIVNIDIKGAATSPTLVQTRAFGLTLAPRSMNIGWVDEMVLSVPDPSVCQVYIVVSSKEEVESLKLAVKETTNQNICILGGGKNEN